MGYSRVYRRSILVMMVKEEVPPRSSLHRPARSPAAERIACPDCGLVQLLPPPGPGELAECGRCARVLAGPATGRVGAPLALAAATLVLMVPAIIAPLMV